MKEKKMKPSLLEVLLEVLWKILPKRRQRYREMEVLYLLVPAILLPPHGREGMMRIGFYLNPQNPMIFLPLKMPVEFLRYVVFHEWVEAREWLKPEKKISSEAHFIASKETIKLAKTELSEIEFCQFLRWLKERDPAVDKVLTEIRRKIN